MNQFAKHSFLAAFVVALGLGAVTAQAQTVVNRPYLIDARNEIARNNFGECWRTGYWTPAAAAADPAGCTCDRDIIPREVCEKAPAVAPAPAPAPVAAPQPPKPVSEKKTISADALFDFDKAVLRPEGKQKLDGLAAEAKNLNLEVIIAVGHTDRIGSAPYNQKLSERRAAAVKTYLVEKGIDPNRVYTEGKGKTKPVTGDTCKGNKKTKALIQCLQPDRRVEIEMIGTTK
ncbi:MAG: OmpA family protein [Betaproteobacteria bacterium]|nr:OmpA family protein [Betaproteobacteria bacterium]